MPNPTLVQYFKDNLGKHDVVTLKNQLVAQGHDISEVEKALTASQGHPKRAMILWVVVAILGIAILVGGFYIANTILFVGTIENRGPVQEDISGMESCTDADCAQEALAKCESATGSYSMFFGSVAVEYEILGPEGEYCKAKSWFTSNPNQGYIGKEMTCLYDSDIPLEDAIKDMSRCTGELAEAILS